MFGMAAIRLGIGPHSSYYYITGHVVCDYSFLILVRYELFSVGSDVCYRDESDKCSGGGAKEQTQ